MTGVLASTAAAVGILDKAVSITQMPANNSYELDKATLKLELANLMVELANAKIDVITTQTLLFDAEQKNKQLEEQLVDKSMFVFKPPLYWKEGDETPFCPRCYEGDNKKYHLRSVVHDGVPGYGIKPTNNWSCMHCKFSQKKSS